MDDVMAINRRMAGEGEEKAHRLSQPYASRLALLITPPSFSASSEPARIASATPQVHAPRSARTLVTSPFASTFTLFVPPRIALPFAPAHASSLARVQASRFGESIGYQHTKRAMDLLICVALIPVLLAVLAACAIAVRIGSPGPVFSHRHFVGRGGRRFRAYQFRATHSGPATSASSSETYQRGQYNPSCAGSVDRDPSITEVGHFLRQTRLEDLPLLFNVLRGDMSLVGPRPIPYGTRTERLWHTARFEVRPGIVSPSEVIRRNDLDGEGRVRLDVAYTRERSVARDAHILIEALHIVLLSGRYLAKRAIDIVLSCAMLVALSPLMLGVATAVRLASPGPVIFRQWRVGKDGRHFGILKFRTMRVDAEAVLKADPHLYGVYVANDFKLPIDVDPRVTPIGRWLRKTSLDELPQLFNVLRGEMSLVGPRPVVPAELAHYRDRVTTLLSALPGLTGAWQTSGRSDIHYPERCDVELEYVEGWTLRQDILILAKTVSSVLSGRGAT